MDDREKLTKVASGYHDLMALQAKQAALTAKMIRACVVHIRTGDLKKRQEGLKGLLDLADMLDKPKAGKD